MEDEVLNRSMFSKPMTKAARNSGIMAGFEDEDMMENMQPEEPEEQMSPMARTPQNPEILMNTLRGDMRSVDARYQELAQMVGEQAAQETPPEVLALLQAQLGAAQQGGIGALPQTPAMPPMGGMPPAGMPGMPPQGAGPQAPEGAPPFPQGASAPQQFRHGGIAYRADGSPEQGEMSYLQEMANTSVSPAIRAMNFAVNNPQAVLNAAAQGAKWALDHTVLGVAMKTFEDIKAKEQADRARYLRQNYAHGGSVEPPTPDGLPPAHYQYAGIVNPLTRLVTMGADKAAMLGQEANIIGGRLASQGFPQQFPAILENVRGPGGRFTAEQMLKYPTLTQHLSNVGTKLADEYPRVAGALSSVTQPVVAGAATLGASIPIIRDMMPSKPLSPEEEARRQFLIDQIPTKDVPVIPDVTTPSTTEAAPSGSKLKTEITPPATPATEEKTTDQFIADQAAKPAAVPGAAKPAAAMSDSDTIRSKYAEYGPLFKEILGDDTDSMRTNAMLLLADAGFKYASKRPTKGDTPFSVFASAFGDLPKGMAALAAQAQDRKIKINTAALQQAVTDVTTAKKEAQALKLEMLKGDYRILAEQAKKGGVVLEDGGAGHMIAKNKDGSFMGVSINPDHPTVKSALNSRWTLNDANPFVEYRGNAPTTVETDKGEVVKLTSTLRSLDNSLSTLDNLKGEYAKAYGPGAWFSDKVNNMLVPVLPSAIVRPDVNLTDTATRISTGMNSILKNIASANDGGRVAVQEQEWVRDTAKGISDPTKFFADKELAAKQFNSMEAMLRNARQQVLTQLGYEGGDYVMRTPNTGTKNDPFVIPADPKAQTQMFNFLGSTIGRIQNPAATVYLKLPNGSVQAFNPGQLQGLIKQ